MVPQTQNQNLKIENQSSSNVNVSTTKSKKGFFEKFNCFRSDGQQLNQKASNQDSQNFDKQEQDQSKNENGQNKEEHLNSSCIEGLNRNKIERGFGMTSMVLIIMIVTLVLNSVINTLVSYTIINKQLNRTGDHSNNQERAQRVSAVEAPLQSTILECPTVDLSLMTDGWTYFDEPNFVFEFPYNCLDQIIIPFHKIIPFETKAKYVQVILMLRSQNQLWAEYWTRLRVINKKKVFQYWLFNMNYPNWSMNTNSETLIIPVEDTRQIRLKSTIIKRTNMFARLFIVAWRS